MTGREDNLFNQGWTLINPDLGKQNEEVAKPGQIAHFNPGRKKNIQSQ